ncbi:MAG: porin, partial [Nitrosomonas sp.]|nr:porin [Nitrosomonas sp.]
MQLFRPILTLVFVISLSTLSNAYALDLYVDTKTKQIFAEPGPGRVHMGTYEKSENTSAKTGTPKKALAAHSQAPIHEDRVAEVEDKAASERLIRLRAKAE